MVLWVKVIEKVHVVLSIGRVSFLGTRYAKPLRGFLEEKDVI